jgi:hypothetical protein
MQEDGRQQIKAAMDKIHKLQYPVDTYGRYVCV